MSGPSHQPAQPPRTARHRLMVGDLPLDQAGYHTDETAILQVARCFFQSFGQPSSQAWLHAFELAQSPHLAWDGPLVVARTLAAVQAMRLARRSAFRFSNPLCKGCSRIVTAHERQWMACLRQMRAGRPERAEAHALLLCESNSLRDLMATMEQLAQALPEKAPVA